MGYLPQQLSIDDSDQHIRGDTLPKDRDTPFILPSRGPLGQPYMWVDCLSCGARDATMKRRQTPWVDHGGNRSFHATHATDESRIIQTSQSVVIGQHHGDIRRNSHVTPVSRDPTETQCLEMRNETRAMGCLAKPCELGPGGECLRPSNDTRELARGNLRRL